MMTYDHEDKLPADDGAGVAVLANARAHERADDTGPAQRRVQSVETQRCFAPCPPMPHDDSHSGDNRSFEYTKKESACGCS